MFVFNKNIADESLEKRGKSLLGLTIPGKHSRDY